MLLAKKLFINQAIDKKIEDICFKFFDSNNKQMENFKNIVIQNLILKTFINLHYPIQSNQSTPVMSPPNLNQSQSEKIYQQQDQQSPKKKLQLIECGLMNLNFEKKQAKQKQTKIFKRQRQSQSIQQLESFPNLIKKRFKLDDNSQCYKSVKKATMYTKPINQYQIIIDDSPPTFKDQIPKQEKVNKFCIDQSAQKEMKKDDLLFSRKIVYDVDSQSQSSNFFWKDAEVSPNSKLVFSLCQRMNNIDQNDNDDIEKYLCLNKSTKNFEADDLFL